MVTLDSQFARRRLGARVPAFLDENGRIWSMEYGPEIGTMTGDAWTYTTQPMQGLQALTFRNSPGTRGLSFSITVANGTTDVDGLGATWIIQAMRSMASRPYKVRIIGSSRHETAGWWYVSDLTVTVIQRNADQEINAATLAFVLIAANPLSVPALGATPAPDRGASISGGGDNSASVPAKSGATQAAASASGGGRRYTVQGGDTLRAIAGNLLGDYSRWSEIARLNNIADPNNINVGQVLSIPAAAGGGGSSAVAAANPVFVNSGYTNQRAV